MNSFKVTTLLTEREVATMLGCKARTIRAERKRGRLAHLKVGNKHFHTYDQVEAYVMNGNGPRGGPIN